MSTEITDTKEFKGWVLYDADCRFCAGLARRFQNFLAAGHFELVPLQTPWVRESLEKEYPELMLEMRLLKPDGRIFGGVDSILEICRHDRVTWPIYKLGKIPVLANILRLGYRWVARHRNCANGACKIEKPARKIVFLEMP